MESLLGQEQEEAAFLESPALQVAAMQYALPVNPDLTGRKLGRYEITARLGAGGMGNVYLARDSRLKRDVALKTLPPEWIADPVRKRRLVHEARAASALNHPNIVSIHDVDQTDGVDFIAMEYVPGKTLDKMIPPGGIPATEALRYAVEIAGALSAAHSVGIVHRDVKPANIMVTAAGQVKVLDFGLAKSQDAVALGAESLTSTSQIETGYGVVLGTAAYMSPEQAQGKTVDARSDVFSFGAVLFEMLTGRRAFERDTKASTLAAIIHDEPAVLETGVPASLQQVIARCLCKDPGDRFRDMNDVRMALEEVQERRGAVSDLTQASIGIRHRSAWITGGTVVALAIGVGTWIAQFRTPVARPTPKVSAFAAQPGRHWAPALSPDGKQVAFAWDGEPDNYDIYVQAVNEGRPRRLTRNPALEFGPVFSPDGRSIAFLRQAPPRTEVLIIPASGGIERRVYTSNLSCDFPVKEFAKQFCGIAWSPDGKSLTVVDSDPPQGPNSIYLLDIGSGRKRKITAPPPGWDGDGLSAFSPDGRSLAFIRAKQTYPSDIFVAPICKPGQPPAKVRRVTNANDFIFGLDWTPDGRRIVFSSGQSGLFALWRVSASGGEPERLPVGGNFAFWPSLSRKGDLLAYSEGAAVWNLWRAALPGTGVSRGVATPVRITNVPVTDFQPALSPDGKRLAFASWRAGKLEIWASGADSSYPIRVTFLNGKVGSPAWSPDGRQIAFIGAPTGDANAWVYLVAADGGNARRLKNAACMESIPEWSRDGRWIYYSCNRGAGDQVWKAPVNGGNPVQLTRNGGDRPSPSLDGTSIYYRRDGWIRRMDADGGDQTPVLELGYSRLWRVCQSGIYVLDLDRNTGPAVDFFAFGTRTRTRLTRLPGQSDAYTLSGVDSFAVSLDGSWIIYPHRDRNEASIMLVDNFY